MARNAGTWPRPLQFDEVNELIAAYSVATVTMIAADGDELYWESIEVVGSHSPTITFTGGTGRFEGAEGSFSFNYVDHPDALEFTIPYESWGTLTY